ncbi:MAG: phosphate regulon transcriptional regulator PhoB [Betaproteobacteria bacterium]|nr:phosphate regulon transcriptional regulator PhoB [Betaproteobacteria bacterium]
MAPTILMVEDESAIRELIALNLQQAGHHMLAAGSAEDALALMRESLPDLILLDWMLPGMSGVEFARRIKANAHTRSIPIIMLTARSDEQDKIIGLEIGSDDYITKPFSPRELNARIKAVLRRRAPQLAGESMEVNGLCLNPTTHRVTGNNQPVELGPTEFRLLQFFMAHRERVHSRTQLLDQVWGSQVFVEERTVDVHIRRLRRALEQTGHDTLIQTVRGIGYRLSVPVAII